LALTWLLAVQSIADTVLEDSQLVQNVTFDSGDPMAGISNFIESKRSQPIG